jgi:hypothetical protein
MSITNQTGAGFHVDTRLARVRSRGDERRAAIQEALNEAADEAIHSDYCSCGKLAIWCDRFGVGDNDPESVSEFVVLEPSGTTRPLVEDPALVARLTALISSTA